MVLQDVRMVGCVLLTASLMFIAMEMNIVILIWEVMVTAKRAAEMV